MLSPMKTAVIGVVLACVGCKKSNESSTEKEPAGSGSASAGPAASASVKTMTITIDGAPLDVQRALLKRLPDGRVQLYLGQSGTCSQLMSSVFDGKDPHILLELPTFLLADGKDDVGVGEIYAGGPSKKADNGSSAHISEPKAGRVVVDLELWAREAKLEGKGRVEAEVCGDQDAPPPQTDGATMTIAGRTFPVRSALKRGADLELTDLPRDCSSAQYLGVRLRREGGTWRLDGTRIPVELSGAAAGLKATVGPANKDAADRVAITLSGNDSVGAYAVALQGTVAAAVDCDYKPPAK